MDNLSQTHHHLFALLLMPRSPCTPLPFPNLFAVAALLPCCLAALITHLPVDGHAEKPLFESLWVLRSAPGWPVVHQDMRNAVDS